MKKWVVTETKTFYEVVFPSFTEIFVEDEYRYWKGAVEGTDFIAPICGRKGGLYGNLTS